MERRGHMMMWAGIVFLMLIVFPDELRYMVDSIVRGDPALLVVAGLVAIVFFQRA